MSDDFEFRIDPLLAQANAGTPRQVCAVKFGAYQRCAEFVRKLAVSGDFEAMKLADFLDHVGINPDFDPPPIERHDEVGVTFGIV